MYPIVLTLHNVLRWVVLVLAVLALLRGLTGWLGRKPWAPAAAGPGRVFTITMDVQFLLGLLLYVALSPVTRAAFADMGGAMGGREVRFFVAEHVLLMLLAVVAAHVGTVKARAQADDVVRYRNMAIWYGLSLLLMLGGMPWFRPMLRLGGA